MQIVVDNKIVGYDSLGKGSKKLVLLHGWGADRKTMLPLANTLSKNYHVYNLDVPGFGESERPDKAWGLTEYSQWLSETLGKLKVRPHGLVGHSNGGAIAIKAVSLGLDVEKLILLGASGIRSRAKGKKLFLKSVTKTGKVATRVLPKKIRYKVRNKWYKKIGSELYDTPGMEEFFKKVASEDLLIDSAMIIVPTLLVYGADDTATPPSYGRLYQTTIDGSEFHTIDGAGHYVHLDQPKQTYHYVEKFLK